MSTSSPPKRKPLGSSQVDSLTDESVPEAASDAMVWSYDWSRVSRRTWAQSYKSERLFLVGKRSQFTRVIIIIARSATSVGLRFKSSCVSVCLSVVSNRFGLDSAWATAGGVMRMLMGTLTQRSRFCCF